MIVIDSKFFKWQGRKGETKVKEIPFEFSSFSRCFQVRSEKTGKLIDFIIEEWDDEKGIHYFMSKGNEYMIAIIL